MVRQEEGEGQIDPQAKRSDENLCCEKKGTVVEGGGSDGDKTPKSSGAATATADSTKTKCANSEQDQQQLVQQQQQRREQENVLHALQRLADSLKDLDQKHHHDKKNNNNMNVDDKITKTTKTPPMHLSHYHVSDRPNGLVQACDVMMSGAARVHAASTKYTLLGKIDRGKHQCTVISDLLTGCQFVSTACLIAHDNICGCSPPLKLHWRRAALAVVNAVQQLLRVFVEDDDATAEAAAEDTAAAAACSSSARDKDDSRGAVKTGAVWQACNVIMEKKLPLSNRAAMKRELLLHSQECKETMDEFQDLIDAGPAAAAKEEEQQQQDGADADDELWQSFLDGDDSQYTATELSVAEACLPLIKCSRGSLNCTLSALDAVGETLKQDKQQKQQKVQDDDDKDSNNKKEGQAEADTASAAAAATAENKLAWMAIVYARADRVGNGMTDLGACLYPPLQYKSLQQHVERQAAELEQLLSCYTQQLQLSRLQDGSKIHDEDKNTAAKPAAADATAEAEEAAATATATAVAVICDNNVLPRNVTDQATRVWTAVRERRKHALDVISVAAAAAAATTNSSSSNSKQQQQQQQV